MAKNKKPSAPQKKKAVAPAQKIKPAPAEKKPAAAQPAVQAGAQKQGRASGLKRRRLLERKTAKPIAFSLDEVREIAKKNEKKAIREAQPATSRPVTATGKTLPKGASRPPVPNYVKPASITDILGFNPQKGSKHMVEADEAKVPEKHRRFLRMLVDLRNHVLDSLGQHTEETLKRSAKDDAGDLSSYGQHMADAGTDTFDRDFALSLVSSEQEALSEIEAAIKRIYDGTYGVCELTRKPIGRDRLSAVPFTRYSAEAQKKMEKTRQRSVQRAGIFADAATEEGGKLMGEESEE